MTRSSENTGTAWVDPDDAPELTDEWFDKADYYEGEKLVRRGRPPSEFPKEKINIRLDLDILERLRAGGPGWQTRANALLRKGLGLPERD